MNELYSRIEARYGFHIPEDYREMQSRGWFDARDKERYLWLHEAEWLSLEAIAEFEFAPHQKLSLCPLLSTVLAIYGAGGPQQLCARIRP